MTEISVLELKPIQISIEGIKLMKTQEMEAKILIDKIEMIKTLVLGYYSQTWNQINVKSRKREIVLSRHLFSYFLRKKLYLSLKQIGANFEIPKHHTSVMNSIKEVEDLFDSDKSFRQEFQSLNKLIDFELNR